MNCLACDDGMVRPTTTQIIDGVWTQMVRCNLCGWEIPEAYHPDNESESKTG